MLFKFTVLWSWMLIDRIFCFFSSFFPFLLLRKAITKKTLDLFSCSLGDNVREGGIAGLIWTTHHICMLPKIAEKYGHIIFSANPICCTLRPWYHEICIHSRTVSPRLEDNYASKCSSENFSFTIYRSSCTENYQNYIAMYRCSPIAGKRSGKLEKLRDRFVP